MPPIPTPTISDGDKNVIFSNTYIVNNRKLVINNFYDITLIYNFIEDKIDTTSRVNFQTNHKEKSIIYNCINMFNILGSATTEQNEIMVVGEYRIFFSINIRSLKGTTENLLVTLTFYSFKEK